jgi:hypothetical protein
MKIVLACLMCLVLGASESFAIDGGPVYPGGTNVVGTYAGVIDRVVTDSPLDCGANSIGVFSVGVPKTGISSGTFVMFSQGRTFTGTIQGVADPGKSTLKGVLDASFNFTVTRTNINPVTGETTTTTTDVTASANGNLKTQITSGADLTLGVTATRLRGTATLSIDMGQLNADLTPLIVCEVTLRVRGFKQSNDAPTTTGVTG